MNPRFDPNIGMATRFKPGHPGMGGRPPSRTATVALAKVALELAKGQHVDIPTDTAAGCLMLLKRPRLFNALLRRENFAQGLAFHVAMQAFRPDKTGARFAKIFFGMLWPYLKRIIAQYDGATWRSMEEAIRELRERRAKKAVKAQLEPYKPAKRKTWAPPIQPTTIERPAYNPGPKRKTLPFWENLEL